MILVYLMWLGCFQPGDSEPALQRQDEVVGSQSELVPSAYACSVRCRTAADGVVLAVKRAGLVWPYPGQGFGLIEWTLVCCVLAELVCLDAYGLA